MIKLWQKRALTVTAVSALIAAVVAILIVNPTDGGFPECPYSRFNLRCTSCGATRAVYYFFTLQFGKAFYYHAYYTVTSPLLAYVGTALALNSFFDRQILPFKLRWQYGVIYVAGLLVFTVARNFTQVIY